MARIKVEESKEEAVPHNEVVVEFPSNVTVHLDRDPNDPRNRKYRESATHSLNDKKMGGLGKDDK